jgi:hypothetical protein
VGLAKPEPIHDRSPLKACAVLVVNRARAHATLPETIEVQTFPADVGVRDYRYAVVGDHTVLVGSNRQIIEVIE